jgi:hypothetical protein
MLWATWPRLDRRAILALWLYNGNRKRMSRDEHGERERAEQAFHGSSPGEQEQIFHGVPCDHYGSGKEEALRPALSTAGVRPMGAKNAGRSDLAMYA